jgi:hypothetical protein
VFFNFIYSDEEEQRQRKHRALAYDSNVKSVWKNNYAFDSLYMSISFVD